MTEYMVQTTQDRNISYHAENKADAKRRAELYGNKVTDVLTMDEWDRYTDKLLGITRIRKDVA